MTFTTINARAYNVFAKIAKQVEDKNLEWQLTLAAAGILPQDYRPFAVAYVASTSKAKPYLGQKGLCFKKDSTEDSRVGYIVDTLRGTAQAKAAARSLSVVSELDKVLKAYAKLSAADKAAFMKSAK